MQAIEKAIYNGQETNPEDVKSLKETCKMLNEQLTKKEWLTNNQMTFADIALFHALVPAF